MRFWKLSYVEAVVEVEEVSVGGVAWRVESFPVGSVVEAELFCSVC